MHPMEPNFRRRRLAAVFVLACSLIVITVYSQEEQRPDPSQLTATATVQTSPALEALARLEIKGRAPKTGYSRGLFGSGWANFDGCDTRNRILERDLISTHIDQASGCTVLSGKLNDPYTGMSIEFKRGNKTSSKVQIDHVVALSDAWQKGAQQLPPDKREKFANDPLNLLAVDGPANIQKGGSDAASWLPPNKSFRCRYVARQIAVKVKYSLWATQAEINAIRQVLFGCPNQQLPEVN